MNGIILLCGIICQGEGANLTWYSRPYEEVFNYPLTLLGRNTIPRSSKVSWLCVFNSLL